MHLLPGAAATGNLYELQAARIEATLSAHKVPARVWQATVTPRFVRYDVTTALGVKLGAFERLDEEIALALGARAVRLYRDGGVLHVEVPRDTPRQVELGALYKRIAPWPVMSGLLGVDEGGVPLLLRLDSPDVAHVLISGTTGSGKTVLARALLLTLALTNARGGLQFVFLDPKGTGFRPFVSLAARWQYLGVVTTSAEAAAVLGLLVAEMERRSAVRSALPRLVVAIDELADLVQTGGAPVVEALTRLTQRGREAGIHVVAATQRPAAALVGGMIKANFPVRLVGSVTSADDARVAAGVSGTEAERLLGRGDFVLVAKGQVIRFQAPFVDDLICRQWAAVAGAGGRRRSGRVNVGQLGAGESVVTAPVVSVAELVGRGGVAVVDEAEGVGEVKRVAVGHHRRRRSLAAQHTPAALREFYAAAGGKLKDATKAAFGYSDPVTLALVRAAVREDIDGRGVSV